MKSIIFSLVAATALWLGGTFNSSADAQVRYRGRYYSAPRYSAPRYYRGYGYYPRYYSRGYYNYPYRSYYRPYNRSYYYGRPYYGPYYRSGVSVGVGPVGIRFGF